MWQKYWCISNNIYIFFNHRWLVWRHFHLIHLILHWLLRCFYRALFLDLYCFYVHILKTNVWNAQPQWRDGERALVDWQLGITFTKSVWHFTAEWPEMRNLLETQYGSTCSVRIQVTCCYQESPLIKCCLHGLHPPSPLHFNLVWMPTWCIIQAVFIVSCRKLL